MISYKEIQNIKTHILNSISTFDENEIEEALDQMIAKRPELSLSEKIKLKGQVLDSIFRYGVIQPLLSDEDITEIMINGPHCIFIEKMGSMERTAIVFEDDDHLMELVEKISTEIDRPINLSQPILDARLKDGSRVNIVLSPISGAGTTITIRKFVEKFRSMTSLVDSNMIDLETSYFLENLVKSRYNIFVCGGTGTGKTTLLNCLSAFIPNDERLITVEDARELNLTNHENIIALETRQNMSQSHDINIATLIKTALRMRPDRIIVGEVRGSEVMDMLQAMNTGHDGSMSTGHANSPKDMLIRLESIANAISGLSSELIRQQIISAIDFIIYIERFENGLRRISKIEEVHKDETQYVLKTHFDFLDNITCNIDSILNKRKLKKHVEIEKASKTSLYHA